jgi:hypothetical protein
VFVITLGRCVRLSVNNFFLFTFPNPNAWLLNKSMNQGDDTVVVLHKIRLLKSTRAGKPTRRRLYYTEPKLIVVVTLQKKT